MFKNLISKIKHTEKTGVGFYLPGNGITAFNGVDGSDIKKFLESIGYIVLANGDHGRYGFATTSTGLHVSSNGYVSLTR